MNLSEWIQETEAFDDREFFGPVPNATIDSASQQIGLPFPAQYRAFLSTVGSGRVGTESFIGLGGPRDLDVRWVSEALRGKNREKPFPSYLIPVRSDGYGNYDAIDTRQPTDDGECALVEWRHEGAGGGAPRVLATSYFGWLSSMLELIREAEA